MRGSYSLCHLLSEKQLLETICFQIQLLKPENIPKPPYNLAPQQESSPPVAKSAGGSASNSNPTTTVSTTSGKGKQPASSSTKSKPSTVQNSSSDHRNQKGGRRLPVPPEPLPPLTNRVSAYSPAISTGILVEAVKAGMNNPEAGLLPGASGAGNMGKGKRKVVRVRG